MPFKDAGMETQSSDSHTPQQPTPGAFLRVIFGTLLISAVLAALLFIPAGRWDWLEAWIFISAYGVFLLFYGIRGIIRDPAQVRERSKPGAGVKTWDKIILPLYSFCLIVLFPVCGLDAGRFRWSSMPMAFEVLGWLGMALAGLIILWVMAVNTFASRMARIQKDRGQTVIRDGPYRYVRHPMYLGIIILFVSLPPALGSWWGLVPAGVIGFLFVVRTALEDRMLARELSGYAEYTQYTRYRLFPGIW
jgi:protein-S-isoprenylcysteine O-methyltransferase Ste14